MSNDRRTAVIVGVLFIIATAFFSVGQAMHGPILDGPDYLDLAGPHGTRLVAGLLIELVGVLAIPLIAIFLWPVLRHHSEALALGYVGFRILESVPLLAVDGNLLALIKVSTNYLNQAAADAASWQTIGSSIQLVSESTFLLSVGIVFPIGAMMVNWMFYRTRLVPRFIATWGLLAAVLLFAGSVLSMFELFATVPPVTLEIAFAGPIAVQEMVLAIWLIVKGFDAKQLLLLRST